MSALLRALRHAAQGLFTWFVALLILFEEWGWEPLARLLARLARIPPVAWLEGQIARLPPYAALAAFVVPAIALLPLKLLAFLAFARGHATLGIGLIVIGKVIGTAVTARMYQLTQPALLRLAWFARWHARWLEWKRKVVAQVRASALWQAARRVRLRLRLAWRR